MGSTNLDPTPILRRFVEPNYSILHELIKCKSPPYSSDRRLLSCEVLDRVLSGRCSDKEARLTSSSTNIAAWPTVDGSGDFRRSIALKHPGALFDGMSMVWSNVLMCSISAEFYTVGFSVDIQLTRSGCRATQPARPERKTNDL